MVFERATAVHKAKQTPVHRDPDKLFQRTHAMAATRYTVLVEQNQIGDILQLIFHAQFP
jgi:hypothetical protein